MARNDSRLAVILNCVQMKRIILLTFMASPFLKSSNMGASASLGVDTNLDSSTVAIEKAKTYFEQNKSLFENQKYIVVIDYSKSSDSKRFHLIDTVTGKEESFLVAHGKGSDPNSTGLARMFGDEMNSHKTALGFFKTTDTYQGKHGYSLRLKGLSKTNRNALARAIVIHAAQYVDAARKFIGRSWGCPALEPKVARNVIDKIKGGALVYSHFGT